MALARLTETLPRGANLGYGQKRGGGGGAGRKLNGIM